jgi:hypothetical protein
LSRRRRDEITDERLRFLFHTFLDLKIFLE